MLLVAVGVVIVVIGGLISGLSDYVQSIFATVGTAIALIGPLWVGERFLTIRVKEATDAAVAAGSTAGEALESARSLTITVADIEKEVRDRLAGIRDDEEQQQRHAVEGRQEAMAEMYEQAAERRWIAGRGLRVPAGMGDLSLRLRMLTGAKADREPSARSVELTFEDTHLREVGEPVVWAPEEKPARMLERLAHKLMDAGRYPGDEVFSGSNLLTVAGNAIAKVRDLHVGSRGAIDVGPIVEFVGEDWAVTTDGLQLLDADLYVNSTGLLYATDHAFQLAEATLLAQGLDRETFSRVFDQAKQTHEALRGEQLRNLGRFSE
jgi:hypothetical protein